MHPTPHRHQQHRIGSWALWIATTLGTIHAGWSIYWAFGGEVLLESVGQWAVDAVQNNPQQAFLVLLGVGLAKLLAAWIPLVGHYGVVPWRGLWRALSWVGGPLLFLYGGANTVVGATVLLGMIDVDGTDQPGLIGHTWLWSPLFGLWGLALMLGLFYTRPDPAQ
ncbi:DUF3995 domain-containing protein [Auritidibacter sp. NML120779]|nr:DUF3995 domain-containing protein [Auritidibacter sp. NML120779]